MTCFLFQRLIHQRRRGSASDALSCRRAIATPQQQWTHVYSTWELTSWPTTALVTTATPYPAKVMVPSQGPVVTALPVSQSILISAQLSLSAPLVISLTS